MLNQIPANRKLLEGNEKFRETNIAYKNLTDGQHPTTVVIACSDSRVAPETIADSELGELFDIRAIGQVIDQSVVGSVEYPIAHLGVKELAIIGHTMCGAVTAAQKMLAVGMIGGNSKSDQSALDSTIADICRGISKNSKENLVDLTHAIIDNAMAQAQRLVEASSIIRDAVADGSLRINIWLYDISTGRLSVVKAASFDKKTESLSFEDLPL